MAYDAERVAKALKALLEEGMTAALDAVEALWSEDPVTLPDPVIWYFGHNPTVLELPSTSFPFVAVMVAGTEPEEGRSQWGYQEDRITVYVDCFVVAEDQATVNKMVNRYVEALYRVMQTERVQVNYQQMHYRPQVQISEASRHAKTANADMFDTDQVDFIQGLRLTVMYEGG